MSTPASTFTQPSAFRIGDVVDATWRDGEVTRGTVVGLDPTWHDDFHIAWADGNRDTLPRALEHCEIAVVSRVVVRQPAAAQPETRVHLEAVVADLLATAAQPSVYDGRLVTARECAALAAFVQDLCDMHDEQAIDLALWPTAAEFARHYLFELDENGDPL